MFRFEVLTVIGILTSAAGVAAADAAGPVPIDQAVASIQVPEGFKATLFAGEPDLVQPIAMTTDAKGRLWVVECLSYPDWQSEREGNDRVSIYEDKDGDGKFDSKKVFLENGRNLSGIEVGFGGVFLCSVPELLFVADKNGDDRPDGEPEVLLDGWDIRAQHNVFNGLNWGPDGWLYGCNGILSNVKVGRPGTPENERVSMNCGVWRYHPQKKTFEAVAHGTTNPWGVTFNENGQIFVANCVIKHLFHIIPGGRYERMFGQDNNPYAFELIPSIADHIHWAGGWWKTEGAELPQNDTAGGGHAHCGGMVYLGETWPERYRGTFFTVNIHGHRVNNDLLVRQGSGFVGQHTNDLLRVDDSWFRGTVVTPSHDGNMYVADWSDAGECHDYEDIHRDNGRVFKITYGGKNQAPRDLTQLSDGELIELQTADSWTATRARLLLQERAANGKLDARALVKLKGIEKLNRLRGLWAMNAVGVITAEGAMQFLNDKDEYVRGWAVQLALETGDRSQKLIDRLAKLAREDSSPVVRLYLASGLQRLSLEQRKQIASGLLGHAEDEKDHNLPLLIWYGTEPVVSANEAAGLKLLSEAKLAKVRQLIAQRLALQEKLDGLTTILRESTDDTVRKDIVFGMFAALNGRRDMEGPKAWAEAREAMAKSENEELREVMLQLSLIFGDEVARGMLQERALDKDLNPAARQRALQALVQARVPGAAPFLQKALHDPAVRLMAIRGLAAFDDPKTAELILEKFAGFTPEEKAEAVNTLASRASYAEALLKGVQGGKVAARDISPFAARQIQAYENPQLDKLAKELGTFRAVTGEKKEQIAKFKELLTVSALEQADLSRGRALFNKTCAACHTLFGEGGTLAPEITGAQRSNLDYLLENIVDPNAVVWDQFKATYFETADDRLISGAVVQENNSTVTIQTQTDKITLPQKEITARNRSNLSMMPEGLLESLDQKEIIDLIGYLQSTEQVPLPPEE